MSGPDAQLADLIDDFVLSSMQASATNDISICQWRTLTAKKPRARKKGDRAYDSGTHGFFQKFKNDSKSESKFFRATKLRIYAYRASLIPSCVVFRGRIELSCFFSLAGLLANLIKFIASPLLVHIKCCII